MGNNVIVGQSGGPTAVINSSLAGVFQAAQKRGVRHIYGMQYGVQGLLKEQVTDLSAKLTDALDIELLKRTPSSFLGSCRYKLPAPQENQEIYEKLFSILRKLDIGYFFYIGGNDSMDTIAKLSDYAKIVGSDIRFMGVPKTIDNDLMNTDHTPGYGSAAKFIGTAVKEIIRDSLVYDMKSVTVVEIMGRNAGWLAGAASLAKAEDCEGADMICLPEKVFNPECFMQHVETLLQDKPSIVVAVSEGVRVENGQYVCELMEKLSNEDAFGHRILTGTAHALASEIALRLHVKTRGIELSTLQRCCSHLTSLVDITEAYQVGGAAVKAAFEGHTGEMTGLYRISDDPYQCTTRLYDIHTVANFEKKVPQEWIGQDGFSVTQDFVNYIRPLVQQELTPVFVDGLPRHIRI